MSNSILDELLKNDKPEITTRQTGAIRYEDIKTTRVNGKRAVILPGGRMLGKVIDRKLGHSFWTIIGNRTVG